MADDIGSGLSSMAVCFDFLSTNVLQLSNWNPYFYRFPCHHPLSTQLRINLIISSNPNNISLFRPFPTFFLFYIFFRERNGLAILAPDTKQLGEPLDLLGI